MLLTVLAIWIGLAVLAALFVAVLGRSALREDQALGHVLTPAGAGHDAEPDSTRARAPGGRRDARTYHLVAKGRRVDAAPHDR